MGRQENYQHLTSRNNVNIQSCVYNIYRDAYPLLLSSTLKHIMFVCTHMHTYKLIHMHIHMYNFVTIQILIRTYICTHTCTHTDGKNQFIHGTGFRFSLTGRGGYF